MPITSLIPVQALLGFMVFAISPFFRAILVGRCRVGSLDVCSGFFAAVAPGALCNLFLATWVSSLSFFRHLGQFHAAASVSNHVCCAGVRRAACAASAFRLARRPDRRTSKTNHILQIFNPPGQGKHEILSVLLSRPTIWILNEV